MGIHSGNKDERKLNFMHKMYFPEIFKGMAFSIKHVFRKKVTIQYPEQRPVLGPEFRGRPVLVKELGQERCVACGLCARACPPLAISMQASETEDPKERFPETFEINMLRCIYCGFCEDVCPEEAIVMSDEYDMNFRTREEAIFAKDRLLIEVADLKGRLKFLQEKRNSNYGEVYDFDEGNNNHSVRTANKSATVRNIYHNNMIPEIKATTVLGVIHNGQVALGADGQATMGATVAKNTVKKVRELENGILVGFAGSTSDAFTLVERLEEKLNMYRSNLRRAAIELAKDWRTDRYLRKLEAMLIVMNKEEGLIISGSGDVLSPDEGIMSIGSGSNFALSAATALKRNIPDMSAKEIVEKSLGIAAEICIYTNDNITILTV